MFSSINGLVELLNHWATGFGQFFVTMAWQVGLLAAILLGLDWCLRRKVRAVVRYWLWMLVLVKLLLPVTLALPTSPVWWFPPDWQPAVRAVAVMSESYSPPQEFLRPVAETPVVATSPVLPAPMTATPLPTSPQPADVPALRVPLRPVAWLFLGWLAVVLGLLALVFRRSLRVHQLVQQASAAPDDLCELLRECHRRVGLRLGRVELRISNELGSPAICGLRRPVILLPRHLIDQLDAAQLRLVFLHELSHWKRGDLPLNYLQTLLQIVYFYNPVVWLTNAMLRRLREQAVDETVLVLSGSQSDDYPATLLDIAALATAPVELSLRLTGVVESKKALAKRIRHIVSRPLPKSAKLGLAGLTAILLLGLVLLPMAAGQRAATGQDPSPAPTVSAVAETKTAEPQATPESADVLSGRITDETGAPVTDAKLELFDRQGSSIPEAKTDAQGRYHFERVPRVGEYQILLHSQQWQGWERLDQGIRIHLDPKTPLVRDIPLKRACRLRIQTVDEAGKPIKDAYVYRALLSDEKFRNSQPIVTDRQGWATLGGLTPSEAEYIVGTYSENFGFAKLLVKLNDPTQVVIRQITLQRGVDIPGKALCSDGNPPVGWHIGALPIWWHFGAWPQGDAIGADGSFTLKHIVPGEYGVSIAVSVGDGMTSPRTVLSNAALSELAQPLAVTLDYPSPKSMAAIAGKVRYVGGAPQEGIHVFAYSEDGKYQASAFLKPGEQAFRIAPVPPGVYRVQFDSTAIEGKTLQGIAAPKEDLEVELIAQAKPVLRGVVLRGDTGKPVPAFRARAVKLRTLRGPNYVVEPRWLEFKDTEGRFQVEVPGPGVYRVIVSVEGLAQGQSEEVNTDQKRDELRITLTSGVSLAGRVVNEEGQPVDGATVVPLSKWSETQSSQVHGFADAKEGAVQTKQGQFLLERLTPGPESLSVTHSDYAPALVRNVEVGQSSEPLTITLQRGGTARGQVFDPQGHPQAGVLLLLQNGPGYGEEGVRDRRLAQVTTDAKGAYEAQGLPEELCYIQRPEQWKYLGVLRQAFLPRNGQTHTVNLGGPRKLSGRLIVNGTPMANTQLLLAGENPNVGIFRAAAKSSADGSFTFLGVQPGERTLYYTLSEQANAWGCVRTIRVTDQDLDLGTVDHRTGTVTIDCQATPGAPLSEVQVALQHYDPIWPLGNSVGALEPRANSQGPFVFRDVPPGKYQVTCSVPNGFTMFQTVETTHDHLDVTLPVAIPSGTASLHGRIEAGICDPGGCRPLKLWSRDRQRLSYLRPKEDGTYSVEHLPAGDYDLVQFDTRDAAAVLQISLRDGESKTLDITAASIKAPERPAFLMLEVFTSEGIPLPGCEVRLEGSAGAVAPHSSQEGRYGFTGPPGTYQVTVSYPGFQSVQRSVELKPVGKDGAAKDCVVRLFLEPEAK